MTGGLQGAALSRRFYVEAVRPLLDRDVPWLRHAAGRLGTGSDVLGLDDAMSEDHDWGCRLTLLLGAEGASARQTVRDLLERELPETFLGHPVRFPTSWDPALTHAVEVETLGSFTHRRLGIDAFTELSPPAWLVLPGQAVLEVVAGPVFADQVGLTELRERLRWYPHDVWLHVLAAGWRRLAQELPLVGRAGDLEDDLGSRLVAARLCRDLVHLAFLLERRWAPYPKWVGTVLAELPVGRRIVPHLEVALEASSWQEREEGLVGAISELHQLQRSLGLSQEEPVEPFWGRPYRTVSEAVAASLLEQVTDPLVRDLPSGVGSIEQWVDSVDVLSRPDRRRALQRSYRAMLLEEGSAAPAGESGRSRLGDVVFDSRHPASLARFWAAALDGYAVAPYDDVELARLRQAGVANPEDDPSVLVEGPPGAIRLWFQWVSEPKSGKNRVHLDLRAGLLEAALARLAALGATVLDDQRPAGGSRVVLADPEGNELCLDV